jgi:hypothetical protein
MGVGLSTELLPLRNVNRKFFAVYEYYGRGQKNKGVTGKL